VFDRKLEREELLKTTVEPFKGIEIRAAKQQAKRKEKEIRRIASEKADHRINNGKHTVNVARARQVQSDQEARRREQRDIRAQQLLRQSALPPRMELYAEDDLKRQQTIKAKLAQQMKETCSFQPTINTSIPDFEASKKKWVDTLNRVRAGGNTTTSDVSNLSMFGKQAQDRKRLKEENHKRRQQSEQDERQNKRDQQKNLVRKVQNSSRGATVNMTKSQELRLRMTADNRDNYIREEQSRQEEQLKKNIRMKERSQVLRQTIEQEEQKRKSIPGYLSLQDAVIKAKQRAKQDAMTWKARSKEMDAKMSNPRPERAPLLHLNSELIRKASRKENAVARVANALFKTGATKGVLDESEIQAVENKIIQDANE